MKPVDESDNSDAADTPAFGAPELRRPLAGVSRRLARSWTTIATGCGLAAVDWTLVGGFPQSMVVGGAGDDVASSGGGLAFD